MRAVVGLFFGEPMRYEYRAHNLLDAVIEWLTTNLDPSDVFSEEELFDWCQDNATDATRVCSDPLLRDWAEQEGYVME
jgi:hypothetical protein